MRVVLGVVAVLALGIGGCEALKHGAKDAWEGEPTHESQHESMPDWLFYALTYGVLTSIKEVVKGGAKKVLEKKAE